MDLQISTGVVEYNLNGKVKVHFNPSDSEFAEKMYNVFMELDKKQEEYKAEVQSAAKEKIFDIARARDAEMREMLDSIFDVPVCDALFGSMNVYAMADGLPVWANLLFAIMDQLESGYAKEEKLMNTRIQKYTQKYKKYMK